MKLLAITEFLETIAPLSLQEAYDNAGLLVGNPNVEIGKALITLDITPQVLDEAIKNNCNLIIAHHPVIFKGLKKITGANMVEQVVRDAIKNNIALYAIHTNLDNVANGVNKRLAQKIELKNYKILALQQNTLKKLVCYCPVNYADVLRNTMFEAGAGNIGNYSHCSFNSIGDGSFKAGETAHPFVGEKGKMHFEKEVKIETIVPSNILQNVINAMLLTHPYEEVAYDIYPIENVNGKIGAGMIGEIAKPLEPVEFLRKVKSVLGIKVLKHSKLINRKVKSVAVCGGSCSFLINKAFNSGADMFITADVKYHDFFLFNNQMTIVDAGHYETEQFTKELLFDVLKKKFPTFALQISKVNTNAVSYF